ncbi:hypothetical protein G9A89_003777 [Geosiphon pyriformis]|nr:hypothetical protein G9A89_003777 [Geosiphon pyriformis]
MSETEITSSVVETHPLKFNESQLLSQLYSYFYELSYLTWDDQEIEFALIKWFTKHNQTADHIFSLVQSQLPINPKYWCLYGYLCHFGIGPLQESFSAFYWYLKAADEAGCSFAFNQVGFCYQTGVGIEQDWRKGFEYIKKSAEMGNPQGLVNLGYCYEYGKGVEKDVKEAFKYHEKAVETNAPLTFLGMGMTYAGGIVTTLDEQKALKWYQKAADAGNCSAQCEIGYRYLYGEGCRKDEIRGFHCFKNAAYWHPQAQIELAFLYRMGHGTLRDHHLALRWFREWSKEETTESYLVNGRIFFNMI